MTTGKSAHGILVGLREVVTASTIVLCAGLGQSAIMSTVSSRMEGRLKSRVDVMMAFRNVRLRNPLRCLEYGGPTLIPTDLGFALASRYGGSHRALHGLVTGLFQWMWHMKSCTSSADISQLIWSTWIRVVHIHARRPRYEALTPTHGE